VQRSSQTVTTNKPTPSFLTGRKYGVCPSCRPTNSVKSHHKSHNTDVFSSSLPGGLQPRLQLLKAPGYLGVGVVRPHVSPLTPVPQHTYVHTNQFQSITFPRPPTGYCWWPVQWAFVAFLVT